MAHSACFSCSRRHVVFGLATVPFITRGFAQAGMPIYCASDLPPPAQLKLHSSSGNTNIDKALIAELKNILKYFPINPGFKFIEDPSPNAFAVATSVVPATQGTVYIGLNLINDEFNRNDFGGVAVAGICAHECAHILQMQTGYMQSLKGSTALLVELHADLLAGYYLGRSRAHTKEHVLIFAQSLFSKGDYNFNEPQHHGTPNQRVRAMAKGYDIGNSEVDHATAERVGADFVRGL
jgi:hypothetical protein